jgi:hypothetical protein
LWRRLTTLPRKTPPLPRRIENYRGSDNNRQRIKRIPWVLMICLH